MYFFRDCRADSGIHAMDKGGADPLKRVMGSELLCHSQRELPDGLDV